MATKTSIANRFSRLLLLLLVSFLLLIVGATTIMEIFRIERQLQSTLHSDAFNTLGLLDLELKTQQRAVSRTAQSQLSINSLINIGTEQYYFHHALEDLTLYTAIEDALLFDYAGNALGDRQGDIGWFSPQLVTDTLSSGRGDVKFINGSFYIIEPINYYYAVQGGIIAKINLDRLTEAALANLDHSYDLNIHQKWGNSEGDLDAMGIKVSMYPAQDLLIGKFDISITLNQPYISMLKEISPWLTNFSILALIAMIPLVIITKRIGQKMATPIVELANEVKAGEYPVKAHASDAELATLAEVFNHATQEINRINEQNIQEERQSGQSQIIAIVDTVIDAIITIDSQGYIATFNPAAEGLFGYKASEVVSQKVNILMPHKFARDHDTYINNYLSGKQARIIGVGREVVARRKDGSTFPAELSVSEMQVSGKRMFTGIIRDITSRKQDEAMKSEFVATVSHELRTPLTSIRGALGLILGKFADELPPKTHKMLTLALRNCERLTLLINDILDIEKLKSDQMVYTFHRNNLYSIITRSIEDNQDYARQHQVRMSFRTETENAFIIADSPRMQQVMANLISNAIKYSKPGDKVDILLSLQGGEYKVEVTDVGTGIPEEFLDHIFDRFSQADSSDTRRVGGTGLGLAITKSIIEAHKGSINFFSTQGQGSTFFFTLPCENAPSLPKAQQVADTLAEFQILFVGHNEDLLTALRNQLYPACEISAAESVSRANLALGQQPFQLVMMAFPQNEPIDKLLDQLNRRNIPTVFLTDGIQDIKLPEVVVATHDIHALNIGNLKSELCLILKTSVPRVC
ncbi:sensor histidine kinase [Grimontia sp. NTOU-MAR1]|uniref:sensor histidine kinase n=1 Tax=Grimontia sp. NTOU-MAR1 TaxID=3111011 RepID=UPI002DBBA710|nr:ATP-binding protein [Grimontia sp. NTOU-MAR1]WRV99310.1 ATP-binding protein [Grimontia sp. NTOU-MAR1]